MEQEGCGVPSCPGQEAQDDLDGPFLERAERTLRVGPQVERRIALEPLVREPGIAHVGQTPQTQLTGPVGPSHQEGPIAVEQAVGLHALAALPSRRLGDVVELHHAAGHDGLSQEREKAGVEAGSGARTHGQSFGEDQRLDICLDSVKRMLLHRGTKLAGDLPHCLSPSVEACAFQGVGGSCQFCQFVGRDGDEAAQGIRAQAPVPLVAVPRHDFQHSKGLFDGIPHAFCRPSADFEFLLNVVQRHPAE